MQRFLLIVAISLVSALYIAFSVKLSGLLGAVSHGHNRIFFAAVLVVVFAIMFLILNKLLKNIKTSVRNVLAVIFIAFLGVFVLGCLTGINFMGDVSVAEKRQLAKFPRRSPFHERFPDEFNKFIDDRVGFRDYAMRLSSVVRFFKPDNFTIDEKTLSARALVGKDHWLFYNAENDDVRHFQRLVTYTQKEFEEMKKHLDKMKDFCDANGIDLYFVMPPNKPTIYPEYYPGYIKQLDKPSYYKLMSDYIKENTKIRFIDIYDNIMKRKNQYNHFHKQDSHWNSAGAYVAYKELAAAILKKHPNFKFIKDEDVSRCDKKSNWTDLLNMVGSYDYDYPPSPELCVTSHGDVNMIKETNQWDPIMGHVKNNSNKQSIKVMMFHDSFGVAMKPFIYESVFEVKSMWMPGVLPLAYEKEILEYKPDIIIWEVIERYVTFMMKGRLHYERPKRP